MKLNLFSRNSNAIDYLKQYSKVSAFRYIWRHKKIQTKGQSGFFKKFENLKSGGLCSKVRLQRPLEADESASLLIYRIESVSRGLEGNTSCVIQSFKCSTRLPIKNVPSTAIPDTILGKIIILSKPSKERFPGKPTLFQHFILGFNHFAGKGIFILPSNIEVFRYFGGNF